MSRYLTEVDETLSTMHENLADQLPGKGTKPDKAGRAAAKRVRRLVNLVDKLQGRCHDLMNQGVLDQEAKEMLKKTLKDGSGFKRLNDGERERLLRAIGSEGKGQ